MEIKDRANEGEDYCPLTSLTSFNFFNFPNIFNFLYLQKEKS